MIKTFVGTLSQVLETLACKFNKRIYIGQLFKVEDKKYVVKSFDTLEDGRISVTLYERI